VVFLPCDKKHLSLKWNIKHKTGLSLKSYQLGTSKAGVFAAEAALFAAILTSLSPDAIRDWKWVVNNNVPDEFLESRLIAVNKMWGCGDVGTTLGTARMRGFPWCFGVRERVSRHHLRFICVASFADFRTKMRDSQRLFLRSLMSKQFLSEKETKNVYQKACSAFGGRSKTVE